MQQCFHGSSTVVIQRICGKPCLCGEGFLGGENLIEGNIPEEIAGSQVSMCSGYDRATLVNTLTQRHTVRQTHRQADRQTSSDRLYY